MCPVECIAVVTRNAPPVVLMCIWCAQGVRGKRTPPGAACRCPPANIALQTNLPSRETINTAREQGKQMYVASASSELCVRCVQLRATHGSHGSHTAARRGGSFGRGGASPLVASVHRRLSPQNSIGSIEPILFCHAGHARAANLPVTPELSSSCRGLGDNLPHLAE